MDCKTLALPHFSFISTFVSSLGAEVAEEVKKLGGRSPGVEEIRGVLEGPGCCSAVVTDTTLQPQVNIGGSASGLAKQCGGSCLRRGTRRFVSIYRGIKPLSLPGKVY